MKELSLALIASESYDSKPDIGLDKSSSRAIIRETEFGLVVAFPGTDNIATLLSDLDFSKTEVDGAGRIHSGFLKSWREMSDDVSSAVSGRDVIFVGHSLGAAIAICAGMDMLLNGKTNFSIYGYEPPKVSPDTLLTGLFRKNKSRINLYKNGNDIITDIPPGWQHPAPLNKIGRPLERFPNTKDHLIDNVIASLEEMKRQTRPIKKS